MIESSRLRKQALRLCAPIVHARCNGNIRQEQRAHEQLRAFCARNGLDFTQVLRDGCRVSVEGSIALQMRGASAVIE